MNSLTVFIGRFSPFHNGHAEVLSRALLSSSDVLVLVGSVGQARNIKNPFTFIERRDMIHNWYKSQPPMQGRLHIMPLEDYPYNDQKWMRGVQSAVEGVYTSLVYKYGKYDTKIKLTGANRDESSWYLRMFGNYFDLSLVESTEVGFALSATKIRNQWFDGSPGWRLQVPNSTRIVLDGLPETVFKTLVLEYNFVQRYKESWKNVPFPPTFVCIDACVVQSGHVLVVKRAGFPGNGLWALPGGFLDQNEKLIDGAVRELKEETDIEMSPAQLYGSIKAKEIFDHPNRSTRGRTITTCVLFKLQDSKSLPKVRPQISEVSEVLWIPIAEAQSRTDMWYEDHHAMMCTMIDRI